MKHAEANPGTVESREAGQDALLERLVDDHGDGVPDEREFMPNAGDLEDACAMLAECGATGDADSVRRQAVAVLSAKSFAGAVAICHADDDCSPDPNAAHFPMPR